MQGDIFNYRRARGVSLLGLVIQLAMAIALAVYTAFSGDKTAGAEVPIDHAALTATVYASMGVVVWISLAFLYDWHARERAEAAEAERLAADAAASVFETMEQEINVAARRLEGIQKFGLPIVSLSVAIVLVTVGVVRFAQGQAQFASGEFDATPNRVQALVVGLALAFIGFVFARFVSGMAKQRVWASLRGGASYAVGTALLGLAMSVAHFVDIASGPDWIIRGLQVAFPLFLIVMGAEIALNFVLDLYRPRKAGEDPQPAYDSRLLGLLAAPDKIAENIGEAINYQFGVEVSKTWFYQLLQRWWLGLVMVVVVVMWLMTAFVVIEPHQKALILTFGEPPADGATAEPGLHVKWPWPMGEVYIPETVVEDGDGGLVRLRTVTGVREMTLGTNSPRDDASLVLWTNEHTAGEEYFNLVQPAPSRFDETAGGEGGDPFSDLSLVAIELPVQWVVDDVMAYDQLAEPGSREDLLRAIGQREALHHLSSTRIDEVLGAERRAVARAVRERLEARYAGLNGGEGAGIEVLFVGSGNVHPPQDVAPSFERVVQARQVRESKIEAARQEEIRILTEVAPQTVEGGEVITASDVVDLINQTEALRASGASPEIIAAEELRVQRILERAGGSAGSQLIEASAQRWRKHMGERGRAALFAGQAAGFEAAPNLYMARHYLDALREVMRESRVYVIDRNRLPDLTIRAELQTPRQTSVFDPEAGSDLQ